MSRIALAACIAMLGSAQTSVAQDVRGVWCRTPAPTLPTLDTVITIEQSGETYTIHSRFGDGSTLGPQQLTRVSDWIWQINDHGEMVRISEDWLRIEFLSAAGNVFSVPRRLGLSPDINVEQCRLEGGSEEY